MTRIEKLVWEQYWRKVRQLDNKKEYEDWEIEQLKDEVNMLFEDLYGEEDILK